MTTNTELYAAEIALQALVDLKAETEWLLRQRLGPKFDINSAGNIVQAEHAIELIAKAFETSIPDCQDEYT